MDHSCEPRNLWLTLRREPGLHYPDRLAGMAYPVMTREASLCRFLKRLPEGCTELMCHPGYRSGTGNPFSNALREQELAVLTSPAVKAAVAGAGIALIGFSDLD